MGTRDLKQSGGVQRVSLPPPPPHTHLVFRDLLVFLRAMGALSEHSACSLSPNTEQITALSTALLGEETEGVVNDVSGAQQLG